MSSNITEAQRKRMEENRQKALQKLALAKARKASEMQSIVPPAAAGLQPSSTTTSNNYSTSATQQNKGKPYVTSNSQPYNYPKSTLQSQKVNTHNSGYKSHNQPITGTCHLISRDRFVVELPYNNQAIMLFKAINGCNFDPLSKKWSFPVSQHDKFLQKMECLKPDIYVGGVPAFVLRALRQSGATKQPEEVDINTIDPALIHTLMPFQAEGIRFGVSREGRVLIADDMGLGKTIQALGIAHYYYSEWPLLIVAPSSMRYVWRESIWNWLPSVNAGSISVVEKSTDTFSNAKVIIMSYDFISKKASELDTIQVVIIDESHHLKNNKTVRTRAAIPIIKNARRAILLSGTPALSRPVELYPQFSAVNTRLFPGFTEFAIRYCDGKQSAYGLDTSGSSNMEELQIVLEATCMIRRMKADVLVQLPSKRRQMLLLDPSLVKVKSKSLQTTAKSFMEGTNLKSMEKRGRLLEYYSETGKAKIDAIGAYIKDLVEDKKKFLCFAHHRSVLDGICGTLESLKCKYIRIDGSTSSEDRNKLVDLFQYNSSVLVAVLSITAANSGITLTAAHLVVFAELFWNPGILTQAEDRAHRIGQMDSVLIQYLVASNTADDIMWPMVQEKLDVLNKAGLSKDNFREASANSLIQSSQGKQREINDFFKPVSTSGIKVQAVCPPTSNPFVIPNENDEQVFDDDGDSFLDLISLSFNESMNENTSNEKGYEKSFKSPSGWNASENSSSNRNDNVPSKKQKI